MRADAVPQTVGEALAEFRAAQALGEGFESLPTWTCRVGPVTLRFPNFRWRREAILRHDLHHVLTGYPCSMRGEFQIAAWEFASGGFPHPAAAVFCFPFIVAGMVWSPRAIYRAYLAGRESRNLYGAPLPEAFLQHPLVAARARLRISTPSP